MTELNLAREILILALQFARKHQASRITQFNLVLNAEAPESLEELRVQVTEAARGTIAEGASVQITRYPPRVKCLRCGHVFPEETGPVCPECAGERLVPLRLHEVRLASIDIDAD